MGDFNMVSEEFAKTYVNGAIEKLIHDVELSKADGSLQRALSENLGPERTSFMDQRDKDIYQARRQEFIKWYQSQKHWGTRAEYARKVGQLATLQELSTQLRNAAKIAKSWADRYALAAQNVKLDRAIDNLDGDAALTRVIDGLIRGELTAGIGETASIGRRLSRAMTSKPARWVLNKAEEKAVDKPVTMAQGLSGSEAKSGWFGDERTLLMTVADVWHETDPTYLSAQLHRLQMRTRPDLEDWLWYVSALNKNDLIAAQRVESGALDDATRAGFSAGQAYAKKTTICYETWRFIADWFDAMLKKGNLSVKIAALMNEVENLGRKLDAEAKIGSPRGNFR